VIAVPVFASPAATSLESNAGAAPAAAPPGLRLRAGESVGATNVIDLPATGVRLVRFKVVDERTGRVREVVTDEATGLAVSGAGALSRERAELRKKYGRVTSELAGLLQQGRRAVLLPVGVRWAAGGEQAVRAELTRLHANALRNRRGLVEAALPAAAVRALARRPFVAEVGSVPRVRVLAVDAARDLNQAPIAASHRLGVGLGLTMAVWELEACVRWTHPDFHELTKLTRPGTTPCDYGADGNSGFTGHATAVAGALAADRGDKGTVGLYRGRIVDIDDTDLDNVDRMWALNPHIVNASFTVGQFEALRIDQEAYRRGSLVFTGAGNNPSVRASCLAYNALCVGGYLHNGTIGQYTDDPTAGGSAYINSDNGREFPQLVGPYYGKFPSATGSGYRAGSGTSFATPAVAGTAGLMLSSFLLPPTSAALVRAVLMASAQAHPVADGGPRVPIIADGYDDRHGVGAPNGGRVKQIMENRSWVFDRTFEPGDVGVKATIKVPVAQRVRVVLAWDQCPYQSVISNDLNADLDLVVRRLPTFPPRLPTEVHSNLSSVDNFEVVEFVSELGGTYQLTVSGPRWSTCAAEGGARRTRMAIAWTTERWRPVNAPR